MRRAIVLLVLVSGSRAHAEPAVGASLGAGARGAATFGALELRLDTVWRDIELGFGARGFMLHNEWEIEHPVTLVRDVRASMTARDITLGLAAGGLAPAHVGRLAEGYRVSLDDRWRTGVRTTLQAARVDVALEVDDVLAPALAAAAMRYEMAPPFGMHLAIATDPDHVTAFEAGAHRRIASERARVDTGVSVIAEVPHGAAVVAFADGAFEYRSLRFYVRGDMRVGRGSLGGLWGPLYRAERMRAPVVERGVGAGLSLGAAHRLGWLELVMRTRPDTNLLAVGGGLPAGRYVQTGVWAAVTNKDAAGVAESRVTWSRRLFSAIQVARLYRDAPMPEQIWSIVAWFGGTSD